MLLKSYTIYDVKTLSYSPPFFQPADGSAVRMLSDLANDTNTMIGRHPKDYSLYCIGFFDDQKGAMLPLDVREHICDAIACIQVQTPIFGETK